MTFVRANHAYFSAFPIVIQNICIVLFHFLLSRTFLLWSFGFSSSGKRQYCDSREVGQSHSFILCALQFKCGRCHRDSGTTIPACVSSVWQGCVFARCLDRLCRIYNSASEACKFAIGLVILRRYFPGRGGDIQASHRHVGHERATTSSIHGWALSVLPVWCTWFVFSDFLHCRGTPDRYRLGLFETVVPIMFYGGGTLCANTCGFDAACFQLITPAFHSALGVVFQVRVLFGKA